MRKNLAGLWVAILVLAVAGCGKNQGAPFSTASAETKAAWESASAAAKAHDYTNAFTGFLTVMSDPALKPGEIDLIRATAAHLTKEMAAAAAAGDAKAKEATEYLGKAKRGQ